MSFAVVCMFSVWVAFVYCECSKGAFVLGVVIRCFCLKEVFVKKKKKKCMSCYWKTEF